MGDCPHCKVFSGSPTCASCKTYFRLGGILQGGQLTQYQEGAVLGALRNCVGALSDLIEVGVRGPFGEASPAGGPRKEPEIGATPLSPGKETKEEEKPKEEKPKAAEKKEKKPKGPGKDKRKAKRKDKSAKARSRSRTKKDRSPETKEKEGSGRGEALKATGSRSAHSEDRRANSPRRREEREERRNEGGRRESDLDSEARRDPSRFGLSHVPIRGSAGRQPYGQPIPAGSRRPAEPVGQPPRERDRTDDRGQNRDYYRDRGHDYGGKRWKGYSHYTRGVEYWQSRKRRFK